MLLRLAAVLAVAAGFLLRFYGIGWSLPSGVHLFSYHPDEILIVGAARNLSPLEGQLNPHFFNYGSLYLYLISFALPPARALLSDTLYTDYLTARLIAAVMGGMTVWLVYLLGRKVGGRGVGVLAAVIMAIMPLHVMHSHYAAVDVPAGFWVAVSLLGAVCAASDPRARWYVLAGLGAGFAGATKYNCALVILAVVGAYVLSRQRADAASKPRLRLVLLSVAVLATAFLVGTPGVVLAPAEFWQGFGYEMWHTRTGHGLVFAGTGSGWWYHLAHNLRYGLGAPMLALCLAGVALALWRRRPPALVLLCFCVPYYAAIGAFEVRFMRYLIPLLPALAVLAAEAAAWAVSGQDGIGLLRRRWARAAVGTAVGAVMVWTVLYSTAHVLLFTGTDPRDAAREWLLANARSRTVGITTEPWFYSPPVSRFNGGPQSAKSFWRHVGESEFQLRVIGTSAEELRAERRPEFVVISDFEYGDPRRLLKRGTVPPGTAAEVESFAQFWDELNRRYRVIARFERLPQIGPLRWGKGELPPHDWMYPYPTVLVYRAKAG